MRRSSISHNRSMTSKALFVRATRLRDVLYALAPKRNVLVKLSYGIVCKTDGFTFEVNQSERQKETFCPQSETTTALL